MDKEAEGAVIDLMKRLGEAWEHGDGEAYGLLFSEDVQYVTAPGERLHGRKSVSESHQQIFDTVFKGTRLGRGYPMAMRELRPGVVLVEAAGSVLFPGEKEQSIAPNGLMTLVVAKEDVGWQIVSFQNTPTGRFRNLRFICRYALSRLFAFRTEWSKARRHMLEEKRRNMAKWH
jgi:uncharacterized protein (TIGR02246 family)